MNTSSSRSTAGFTLGSLLALVALAAVCMAALISVKVRTVHGNEIGVLETYSGVDPTPLQPGTYFWMLGFGKEVYTYETSGQVLDMNDVEVNSSDNQQVILHVKTTYLIDPAHVVDLHKHYRSRIENNLLVPEEVNYIGRRARVMKAIDLYSGDSLNIFQTQVEQDLKKSMVTNGLMVTQFIIRKPDFKNQEYVNKIEQRQLAIATESMALEQQKANQALADAAKTAALKQQYEEVVQAQTAAQRMVINQQAQSDKATIQTKADALNLVTNQEAAAQVTVINAKAEAARQIAISEANKQAEINRAVGIRAVGGATADANKLLLTSYSVAGADYYTRIQVAKSFADAFSGVKGWLPNNMSMNFVAENYSKSVQLLMGTPATQTAVATSSTTKDIAASP